MSEKIKVSLLIDNNTLTGYDLKIIKGIQKGNFAAIVSIITLNSSASHKVSDNSFSNRLYQLYMRFENFLYPCIAALAKKKSINDFITDTPFLSVPDAIKSAGLVEKNKLSIRPDVLINISSREVLTEFLNIPTYAVWSISNLKNDSFLLTPKREVLTGEGETCVELKEHKTLDNEGNAIDKAWFLSSDISILKNIDIFNGRAAFMLLSNLKRLYRMGQQNFDLYLHDNDGLQTPQTNINKTTALTFLFQIFSLYFHKVRKMTMGLFFIDQWILYYQIGMPGEVSFDFTQFKKIIPPADRLWGDPFVVYKDNKYFIFIEELFYKTNKGHLSVMEMDENENLTTPKPILVKDYHLSYPFIFEKEGEHYMIPETSENNTIDLYKCKSFPYEWEFSKTLMNNVEAVDATIHFHENKYWMFVNIKTDPSTSTLDELHLFYADNFDSSDWQPHIQNPISNDVKTARPAGKIIMSCGEMFRPSQNSSKYYGRGMHIAKITVMNKHIYKTESVKFIYADWEKNLISTHTLNNSGKMTIIDAQQTRLKWQ